MNGKTDRRKLAYRFPPCPAYDIEAMESWLGNMAASGLFLAQNGFFAGFARFERGAPAMVRYRLEAAQQTDALKGDASPDGEALALSEACGWAYLGCLGRFSVFATRDADAPELNTDPKVQALSLRMVRRRELAGLLSALFWLLVFPLVFGSRMALAAAVQLGSGFFLLGLLIAAWSLAASLRQFLYLARLHRRLRRGLPPDHRRDWRKKAGMYRASALVFLVLTLVWCGCFLQKWQAHASHAGRQPLQSYTGSLPFATMEDLAHGAAFRLDDISLSNYVEERSDWLAPRMVKLSQSATLWLEDGRVLQGGLLIDYYETRSPWLARELAREYEVYDRKVQGKEFQPLTLPPLEVDSASAYTAVFPTLVVTDGSRMMRLTFFQTSPDYVMPLEEWAPILAESIRSDS